MPGTLQYIALLSGPGGVEGGEEDLIRVLRKGCVEGREAHAPRQLWRKEIVRIGVDNEMGRCVIARAGGEDRGNQKNAPRETSADTDNGSNGIRQNAR